MFHMHVMTHTQSDYTDLNPSIGTATEYMYMWQREAKRIIKRAPNTCSAERAVEVETHKYRPTHELS